MNRGRTRPSTGTTRVADARGPSPPCPPRRIPARSDQDFNRKHFGLSQSFVDANIASGKVLMEHKRLTIGIDEAEVAAKSLELSKKLRQRF